MALYGIITPPCSRNACYGVSLSQNEVYQIAMLTFARQGGFGEKDTGKSGQKFA